ncbi:hypothetical protein LG3211_0122 [Lysobacter gummosus]|nr:hypothetical protein LG3211_0122 [Lysobacter gummosus]
MSGSGLRLVGLARADARPASPPLIATNPIAVAIGSISPR